jgi:hypothetical protein
MGGASLSDACALCLPGSFAPLPSSASCTQCAPGTYSSAPGAVTCDACASGSYSNLPGGTSPTTCSLCPVGMYNPVPGQTFAACLACPAGTFSGTPGARALAQCAACEAGYFSAAGAPACVRAPAGAFSGPAAGQSAYIECPLGTWSGSLGATSAASCKPCPPGTTTASTGASTAAQCLAGAFACPLGTQPDASGAPPSSLAQCVPLACPWPLRPSAALLQPNASDEVALNASSTCAGCGGGTAGALGACARCAPGELCPGLLSRPLWNFSAVDGDGAPVGGRALAARASPWLACPRLASPRASAPTKGGAAAPSRPLLVLLLGGSLFGLLIVVAAATARARGVDAFSRLVALFRCLDMYAMNHELDDNQVLTKRRTALGGVCTLLALTLLSFYAAYMVMAWQDNNTLVQRSLDALDGGVWAQAGALPWAAAPLPGPLTAPASGFVVRLTVDGEPGACAAPLAPPLARGLVRGTWALSAAAADCGGSGVSQLTYTCADCEVGASSSLSLLFHYSCQSLLLEAAAVAPYPEGTVSLFQADPAATSAAPSGGELLAAVSWDVGPLLGLLWSNVSSATSKRGYVLTRSSVATARGALPFIEDGALLAVAPLSAAVNVTILLPLSATYVTTLLTERVPWTQLVANIVGLSGILGVFGTLFGLCEKRLARGGAPGGKVVVAAAGEGAAKAAAVGSAAEGLFSVSNPLRVGPLPVRRRSAVALVLPSASAAGAHASALQVFAAQLAALEARLPAAMAAEVASAEARLGLQLDGLRQQLPVLAKSEERQDDYSR